MRWLALSTTMLLAGCSDCPTLHLDRGQLVWEDAPLAQATPQAITIENLCSDDAPVEITAQIIHGDPFSLRDEAVTLVSGSTVVFEVDFTPPEPGLYTDTMLLFPDGLDQVEIALAGEGSE